MSQKLAIISDIHANVWALDAVLNDARERGIMRIVNLGDTLYGPLHPLATYKLLHQTEIEMTIAGDQDRKIFEASHEDLVANETLAFVHANLGREPIEWLRGLPSASVLDEDFFLCHGTPVSDTVHLLEDVSRSFPVIRDDTSIRKLLRGVSQPVVLCGHSHVARVVQISTGQLIVNPGSVGLPAYNDDQLSKNLLEAPSPHASYAILEKGYTGWGVSLHRVAYDWNAAASQAQILKRQDWARGLTSGRCL